MGKRFAAVIIFAALIISSGCTKYSMELKRATESGRFFSVDTWDAKLIWHATFFDDEYRQTLIDYYTDLNRHEPEEAQRFADDMAYRAERGWEFVIGMYTKRDYRDFSMDADSFWKLYLKTESGEEIKPIEIEQLPSSPYQYTMFPYLDRWSRAYRVVFPKVELGKKFQLILHSVVGESTVTFKNK